MSDEFRMDAVVNYDRRPLRQLIADLLSVKGPNLTPSREAFDKFQESVRRSTVSINEGYNTAVTGIGLKSFAVAGVVAGLADSIRSFANTAGDLKKLSAETGISIAKLQALQTVAGRLGSSSDEVSQGLQKFYGNLYDVKRGVSDLIPLLMKLDPTGSLVAAMRKNSPEKALDIVMEYLGKLRGVDVEGAGRLSEELFGNRGFARMMKDTGRFQRMIKETYDRQVKIGDDDLKAAQQYKELLGDMVEAADKLKSSLGQGLLPILTETLKLLKEGIEVHGGIGSIKPQITPGSPADRIWQSIRPLSNEEKLDRARKRLDDMDSALAGNRDPAIAQNLARNRAQQAEEIRKLEEATRKGSKEGIQEGLEETAKRMSYGGGGSFDGAKLWNASLGGGGAGFPGRRGGAGGAGGVGAGSGESVLPFVGGAAGRGSGKPEARGRMMGWAMEQLRKEGVPEGNLRAAAAHLVGQADMESGLNPNAVHDGGTGYGIYGARDPRPGVGRRTNMLRWLAANGFERNSAEGQMRYMAHEAMSGRYKMTRNILMNASPTSFEAHTNAITREFESPAVINRRSGAVRQAFYTAVQDQQRQILEEAGRGGRSGIYERVGRGRNGNSPLLYPWNWAPGKAFQSAKEAGAFGLSGPEMKGGRASLDVNVRGDGGADVKANGGDLFNEVNVNRGRSMVESADL